MAFAGSLHRSGYNEQNDPQVEPKSMLPTSALVHMPYRPNPHAPAGVSPKWVDRCLVKAVSFGSRGKRRGLAGTHAVVPGLIRCDGSDVRPLSPGTAVRVVAFERRVGRLGMA